MVGGMFMFPNPSPYPRFRIPRRILVPVSLAVSIIEHMSSLLYFRRAYFRRAYFRRAHSRGTLPKPPPAPLRAPSPRPPPLRFADATNSASLRLGILAPLRSSGRGLGALRFGGISRHPSRPSSSAPFAASTLQYPSATSQSPPSSESSHSPLLPLLLLLHPHSSPPQPLPHHSA